MKFIRGVTYSVMEGTEKEIELVRDLLVFEPGKPSFLWEGNVLYTGLVAWLQEYAEAKKLDITVADNFGYNHPDITNVHIPKDYLDFGDPNVFLRPYQIKTCQKAIAKGRGILELATGAGKTECAAVISKYLSTNGYAKKIYIVTETRFLMNQMAARLEERGVEGVSRFGGGNDFEESLIQVCVVDSLLNALKSKVDWVVNDFKDCDCVIFDEVHHLRSESWVLIGELCNAKYRFGLTATLWSDPFEFSHEDFRLIGLTGPIVASIPSIVLRNAGYLAEPYVTMVPVHSPVVEARSWDKLYYQGIVTHPQRNSYILSLAKCLYEGNFKVLTFVGQISHGLKLVRSLTEMGCRNSYFVKGGELVYKWLPSGRWDINRTSIEELAALVRDAEKVNIVGTSVLDEGVDVPSFNVLIMGTAMMKYRRSLQRAGRGMRPKQGDNSVYIFDFVDNTSEILQKHSEYRIDTYEQEMYDMTGNLETAGKRLGVPLSLQENLYEWSEEDVERAARRAERREKRKERHKKNAVV